MPLANRAVLVSGQRPQALLSVEEAILHLGTDEDRTEAQRILLRAQDAFRMELPGAHAGFIWVGCLQLNVGFLDDRLERSSAPSNTLEPAEVRRLWSLLDRHVRDLPKSALITSSHQRAGVPDWPGVVLHSSARCAGDTRAWIGFHCVTNMSTEEVANFSLEGGVLPGPLLVCAAVPDETMKVEALQDPERLIPETLYSRSLRERFENALQEAMVQMPQLKLSFDGSWSRMSKLVERGDVEGAASMLLMQLAINKGWSVAQVAENIRSKFPNGLELVCGSVRTEHPVPGQAVFLALYGANGDRIVTSGFAGVLPGTVLSAVADATVVELAKVGLAAKPIVLAPRAPIQRLSGETVLLPCADGVYRNMQIAYFGKRAWGFKRFDWETGWKFDGPSFQSDEAFRKLGQVPHPFAMQLAGVDSALAAHYEEGLLSDLEALMRIPGRASGHAIECLLMNNPGLQELEGMQYDQDMSFDTDWYAPADGITPPEGVYCAAHWRRAGGVLMVAKRSLMDRLEQTSIEKGFPLKSLKLPYPDIYFHFEKPLKHEREDGLKFILTGFYASEETVDVGSISRRLALSYTYLYDGEVMRIGGLDVSLDIGTDDTRDIVDVVTARRERIIETSAKLGQRDVSSVQFTNDTLVTAAKVVLYTTLKNARMTEVTDRSRLVEQLRNLKGNNREKEKLRDRIAKAFDCIVIGPEELQDAEGDAELRAAHALEARGIKPHWRRGFYRTQHYGEARRFSYDVWIPPVLVNGHLVDGAPPVRKDYVLD